MEAAEVLLKVVVIFVITFVQDRSCTVRGSARLGVKKRDDDAMLATMLLEEPDFLGEGSNGGM